MVSSTENKDEALIEELRKISDSAEHYTKEELTEMYFDGKETIEGHRRMLATLAQMALDGELDPDGEET